VLDDRADTLHFSRAALTTNRLSRIKRYKFRRLVPLGHCPGGIWHRDPRKLEPRERYHGCDCFKPTEGVALGEQRGLSAKQRFMSQF
jgi:hypothetical protein